MARPAPRSGGVRAQFAGTYRRQATRRSRAPRTRRQLADGFPDPWQSVGVNDDRESVALGKCFGLHQNLRDVEKARVDAHHWCYELRRRFGSLDNERTRSA